MKNETIKVGFVGHGGIARSLYTEIYGNLAEIAQVVAVEAIEDLKNELSNCSEYVSQQDQSRLSVESIINDSEPLVPIEIPHHYVELTRAIYKASEEPPPVKLPLSKDDPFYTFEGRPYGTASSVHELSQRATLFHSLIQEEF